MGLYNGGCCTMLEFFCPNSALIPLILAEIQGWGTSLEFFRTNTADMGGQFRPEFAEFSQSPFRLAGSGKLNWGVFPGSAQSIVGPDADGGNRLVVPPHP